MTQKQGALECAQQRTTLYAAKRLHCLQAHVLVNEIGFTRFSMMKCFLLHLHTLQEVDGIQEMAQEGVLAMPC